MSVICRTCGKSQASTRAGSLTSYFFQEKYCQCHKNGAGNAVGNTSDTKQSDNRICLNCGKSCPVDQKVGSFTAYLFKELRCQCLEPKFARSRGGKNSTGTSGTGKSRTRSGERTRQKRPLTQTFKPMLPTANGNIVIGPGTIIGGTFKIEKEIGAGAMGVIYLAEHLSLRRQFALKILEPSLISATYWQRFQTEAKILAALNHPNLVNVYDLGIHEKSVFYYSMDYLQGRNLEQILFDDGPLTVKESIEVFLAVLDGLAYAHRNGIVHRDIKPANIFICHGATISAASVKILDFGISKLLKIDEGQKLTQVGEIFGSPYYMSPEQCTGGEIDLRSDIYSVGCSLFETLTGFVPFEADSSLEIAMMHEEQEPPLLSEVTSTKFPDGFDIVIGKCLAKLPRERYQSAKEMALDLQRIKEGKSVADYAPVAARKAALANGSKPSSKKSNSHSRSNSDNTGAPLLVAGIVTLLLAGVAAFAWSYFSAPKAPAQPPAEVQKKPQYYSRLISIDGRRVKRFEFPEDFSLGTISYFERGKEIKLKAQGLCDVPADSAINLKASSEFASRPHLLAHFRKDDLQGLDFWTVDGLSEDLLPYVSKLTSLVDLSLRDTPMLPGDVHYLDDLPNLKSIKFGSDTDYTLVAKCKYLPQWTSVSIAGPASIEPILQAWQKGNQVRDLFMYEFTLSKKQWATIAKLEHLRMLELASLTIHNSELEQFLPAKQLRVLKFYDNCKLDTDYMKVLRKFKQLKTLRPPVMKPDHEKDAGLLDRFEYPASPTTKE